MTKKFIEVMLTKYPLCPKCSKKNVENPYDYHVKDWRVFEGQLLIVYTCHDSVWITGDIDKRKKVIPLPVVKFHNGGYSGKDLPKSLAVI